MALAHLPSAPARHPDIATFAAGIAGTVIVPGDEAYDVAREVKNAAYDRYPAMIVRAATVADVTRTVLFAGDAGLDLAVRGGSHSLAGFGTVDGGIVLDLGAMRGLHIDPDRQLAWAEPGLTAGEYTRAAAAHGLATPFGDTASVGIGGLTLGGGIGWLVRKHGLAIDALVSVDIVTADGRLLTASETQHPDLFWAVRGGGGNFGVVTRFQFRLYPVDTIVAGMLFFEPTRDVLRGLVPVAASAPEGLTTISMLMPAPPAPFVPAHLHFRPVLAVMFAFDGPIDEGQAALEPFRALAAPVAELVAPMPYVGIYDFYKEAEKRGASVHRSLFLEGLPDGAVDAILGSMATPSSPFAMTQIRVLGGQMARVDPSATAFAHRDAQVMWLSITPYEDPASRPAHDAWSQSYMESLLPYATGVYSNFLEEEGDARIAQAYPAETSRRLADVKRRYDPTNLFHLNQNIRPASDR